MTFPSPGRRPGFTLLELLMVVAIIALLAAMIYAAIDPAKRLNMSRNTRRWSDITAILRAVKTYQADNGGTLPSAAWDSTDSTAEIIGESPTCSGYQCPYGLPSGMTIPSSGCAVNDFDTDLADHIKTLPYDPRYGSNNDTKYWVNKLANGIVELGTCRAEGEGSTGTGSFPTIRISS